MKDTPTAAPPTGRELSVIAQMATTFRVLGDPSRVRLILVLLQHGEVSVGDLARQTDMTETACSHSLRLLRAERIVRHRKAGRSVLYSLDDDHIVTLIDVARDHVQHRERDTL